MKVNFYVLQDLAPGVLIGMDFLNQYFAKLDFEKGKLQLKIDNLSIETKFLDGLFDRNRSYLVTRSFVKPSQVEVEKKVKITLPKNKVTVPSNPVNTLSPVETSNINQNVTLYDSEKLNQQTEVFTLSTAMSIRTKVEQLANIADEVGHADREKLILLLCRYKDNLDTFCPVIGGNSKVTPIKLDMIDDIPVKCTPYRLSIKERHILKELVQEYMDKGLVKHSNSPYAAPAMLVRKNSKIKKTRRQDLTKNDFRVVVDYKKVNSHIKSSAWPLERADDIFAQLANSKFYITVDLKNGFHQLPLEEQSQPVLAFVTQDASYVWTALPFGVCIGPNIFQRTMKEIFHDFGPEDLLIFMDDIIIHADSIPNLMKKFEDFSIRIQEVNLKLNLEKCQFLHTEIALLGHRISKDGIKVSQDKIKSIVDAKTPKNVKQVRQFLGLSG